MVMEKFLHPQHPVRCIIARPSECGENFFLTNLIFKIVNEAEKTYIYSPSRQKQLYQKN